jgi:hypothetical protein
VQFHGGVAMTKTGVVRPWSDVAWDLARAAGVDPDAVADELDRLTDDDWDREAALLEGNPPSG